MATSFDEIDQIFFNDGYKLAKDILPGPPGVKILDQLTVSMYEAMDGLLEAFSSRASIEGRPVQCTKGCHWCCSQAVFINPLEAFYLVRHIREHMNGDKLAGIRVGLRSKNEITSELGLEDKLIQKIPCPLLENKACSVYTARPMACRIYLSMDIDSCIKEFSEPDNPSVFPRLFDFPLHAGRMFNEGMASRLREFGIQMTEITLENGLYTFLEFPHTITDWIEGKEVFGPVVHNNEESALLNRYYYQQRSDQQ